MKIFKVPNEDLDTEYPCPYCECDLVNTWHEIVNVNNSEVTYTCNFKEEWIGADIRLLDDQCCYLYRDECIKHIDSYGHVCAKYNCGAGKMGTILKNVIVWR